MHAFGIGFRVFEVLAAHAHQLRTRTPLMKIPWNERGKLRMQEVTGLHRTRQFVVLLALRIARTFFAFNLVECKNSLLVVVDKVYSNTSSPATRQVTISCWHKSFLRRLLPAFIDAGGVSMRNCLCLLSTTTTTKVLRIQTLFPSAADYYEMTIGEASSPAVVTVCCNSTVPDEDCTSSYLGDNNNNHSSDPTTAAE